MAKLIFFDKDHTYQVDGEIVPSVSEIIRFISREIYESATQWRLDNAADRGTRIHRATENIDRYGSAEITRDIEPYVTAYVQLLKDYAPQWERIEYAMYHEELAYAGTIDRYGVVRNRRLIVDIKSSSRIIRQLVDAQLNGYALAAENNGIEVDGLAVLHLLPDGRYRFKEVERDERQFLACLTLHNALKKKPRKKKEVTDGTSTDAPV